MDVKAMIKNKGLGYWICAGAALAAFVLAIVVFATWDNALPNRVTDGFVIGIVLLVAVALQAAVTFFPLRFASVLSVAVYGISFGTVILRMADTVADFVNQVAYQGGQFGTCMFYAIACLLLGVAALTACFFAQNKDGKYLI